MKYLKILLLLCPIIGMAQSGWDELIKNDHRKARSIFTQKLGTDSTDFDALTGLLFLADIEQDHISYRKLREKLVLSTMDPVYIRLFGIRGEEEDKKLAENDSLPVDVRYYPMVDQLMVKKKERKFAEFHAGLQKLLPKQDWWIIGPFRNLSGSGHIKEYLPETEKKHILGKAYDNGLGTLVHWTKPAIMSPKGRIDFEDYLPSLDYADTYYSLKQFSLDKETPIQFRFTRNDPMKIWIDGKLVFENGDVRDGVQDDEVVETVLSAGNHELLVKMCSFTSITQKYKTFELFGRSGSRSSGSRLPRFRMRMTNADGWNQEVAEYKEGGSKGKVMSHKVVANRYLNQILDRIGDESKRHWSDFYMLECFFKDIGRTEDYEHILLDYYDRYQDVVYFKYLMARVYANNGKVEKSYIILDDIDHQRTPIVALLLEDLSKINSSLEEEKYLAKLRQIDSITPSNRDVVGEWIDYYDQKNDYNGKIAYLENLVKDFSSYEYKLENEKRDTEDEKKKDKNYDKMAAKAVKKEYGSWAYNGAIRYYKKKAKREKVLALYDEMIQIDGHDVGHYEDKADFLMEKELFKEALETVNAALKVAPLNNGLLELKGDAFKELAQEDSALHYYKLAREYSDGGGGGYWFSGAGIQDKIKALTKEGGNKDRFETQDMDDFLSTNTGWVNRYMMEDAVIIYYTKDAIVDEDGNAEMYQQMAVRINNEAGADSWLEMDFGFMGSEPMVKVVKPNGAELVPDMNGAYAVFKNLEPGDMIKAEGIYDWNTKSEFGKSFNLQHYLSFQSPVYYTKFEVAVSPQVSLNWMLHKVKEEPQKSHKDGYDFYTWQLNDIPKIKDEEARVDNYDLYAQIHVTTNQDWTPYVDWYLDKTYRKLEMDYQISAIMDTLIKEGMSDQEKVVKIYDYITREIRYSFVSFLQSGFIPKDPGLTCSAGIGDCKDVATLMITMLKQLGIESYYVLVKTNSYNHMWSLPMMKFDHVIVGAVLNGKMEYYDLTTNYYPHYVVNENDIGALALLIKKGEKEAFLLPDDQINRQKNEVRYSMDVEIRKDRSLYLSATGSYRGLEAGRMRESMSQMNPGEQFQYLIDRMEHSSLSTFNLDGFQVKKLKEINPPLEIDYTISATNYSDNIHGLIIFEMPYLVGHSSSSALMSASRVNRLDLTRFTHTAPVHQEINVEIPKGYRLYKLPSNINETSEFGTYTVSFKKTRKGMKVTRNMEFNQRIVEPEQFDKFKEYYLTILDLDQSKIALIER